MPVVEANGTKTIVSLATQLIILYVAFYGFAIVVYGGAVKLIGKTSPVKFFKAIMPAALNAFGTCSSSATIPISKRCVEKELGVSNQISSIAIPLGATVNMDAVSILMSFMIMFFANACGINVSISMMVIILLANVLLSVGTPGIPGGAIASFAALATMAGLPAGVMGVYISINTLCGMPAGVRLAVMEALDKADIFCGLMISRVVTVLSVQSIVFFHIISKLKSQR